MALIDDLLNLEIPMYNFSWSNEPAADASERPRNLHSVGELISTQSYPDAKVHLTYAWVTEIDEETHWVDEHVHDYDEILMWTGSDPDDPHDLGAELYVEIEGERRTFTTSGSIYVPAGVRHCPLGFIRVNRPFIWHALSLSPVYASVETDR
ncbi:hypothetical protein [Microbacterium resistens]|uniref:hypothetical protein n=1 Tax=Microbacterium resistens TaxID=156977 RepID=UPI00082E7156|nr:hypothetical protein [Microbacterium resistens]